MSTQQSTLMDLALEDGSNVVVALGGGIGSRRWEVVWGSG
jgi:hypothetical protein